MTLKTPESHVTTLRHRPDRPSTYPLEMRGYDVVIVGGGTSLVDFQFEQLRSYLTIGCNMTGLLLNADVLVSIDPNFIKNYRSDIEDYCAKDGIAVLGRRGEVDLDRVPAILGATDVVHMREYTPDPPEGCISGTNSGYAALSLAIQARASRIHLLGFDMRGGPMGKHFFGNYVHGTSPASHMANWYRPFERVPEVADRLGIEIINWVGEPRSTITAFETRPLEKFGCLM